MSRKHTITNTTRIEVTGRSKRGELDPLTLDDPRQFVKECEGEDGSLRPSFRHLDSFGAAAISSVSLTVTDTQELR